MIESPNEVDTLKTYQALLISKREVIIIQTLALQNVGNVFKEVCKIDQYQEFSNIDFQVFLHSIWNESTNSVNYR